MKRCAKGWIETSRWLRKGDPPSPFLFAILVDMLSRSILREEDLVVKRISFRLDG